MHQTKLLIKVKIKAVLDTGSPISINSMRLMKSIQPENFREINEPANHTYYNGNEVKQAGELEVTTKYDGKQAEYKASKNKSKFLKNEVNWLGFSTENTK